MRPSPLSTQGVGVIVLLIASLAVVWIWVPGGRATSDTPSYLEGARHLAVGDGFVTSHVRSGASAPRRIVDFPLGFSLLMLPGIWAGLDAAQSGAAVVAMAYVAYGLATYLLLLAASGARWPGLTLLLVAALLLSPGVLLMLDTIASDLPGAALAIAAAGLGFRLIARPAPTPGAGIAIGVLFGCALLTRWSALYLVIPFALGMFLSAPPAWRHRQRWRAALVVLLVPLAMAGPWILRNHLATRTLFGYRRIRFADPLAVAADALHGLFRGTLDTAGALGRLQLGVTTALAALTLFALARRGAWRNGAVRLALVSGLGYGTLLVLSAATSPIDSLRAPRFWLPAWPLLAALVLATASHLAAKERSGSGLRLALALLATVGGYQFGREFLDGSATADSRRGLRADSLATSSAMAYVRRHDRVMLLCNDPRVVLANRAAALVHELPPSPEDVEPLLRRAPVAILLFTATASPVIDGRLPAQRQMLRQLERDGLLLRRGADAASELWLSRSAPPPEP
jgi:hypothetical protein